MALITLNKLALPTGSVLQVVSSDISTGFSTNSASYVDTGLSVTITPLLSTSKLLMLISGTLYSSGTTSASQIQITDSSNTAINTGQNFCRTLGTSGGSAQLRNPAAVSAFIDSPGTTAETYKVRMVEDGTGDAKFISGHSFRFTIQEIKA